MPRYRAMLSYDGTDYSGFQVQPIVPTIQGEIERVLERLVGAPVRVHGSGRTDAGVHARGQVVHFEAHWGHTDEDLCRAMNALLAPDIAIQSVSSVEATFHARFGAVRRQYAYSVHCSPVRVPFLERYSHRLSSALDVQAMDRAARGLEGTHDFAAFGQPPGGHNTVRTVFRAGWQEVAPDPCLSILGGHVRCYRFEIEANAFLRGMVRRIVGGLLQVGTGTMRPAEFQEIMLGRDIHRSAPPAPPCGLCLWQVQYPA